MQNNLPVNTQQDILLQKEQHEYEIAKLNIEKTFDNNAMWAAHWSKMRVQAYIFTGIILCIVLAFCVFAMCIGKDAIAMEIIKAGIFLTAGGGVGYAMGRRRGNGSSPD